MQATVLTPSTNLVRKSTLALLKMKMPSLNDTSHTTMNCDSLKCVSCLLNRDPHKKPHQSPEGT